MELSSKRSLLRIFQGWIIFGKQEFKILDIQLLSELFAVFYKTC